jgi:FkbM family methyltransferase
MNERQFDAFEARPIRKLVWMALWPVREYVRRAPLPRGKGLLLRRVLTPALPNGTASFTFLMDEGTRITLRFREALGRSMLISQGFEEVERRALRELATEGSAAIDVGANVGLFTLSLATAVGGNGVVFAIEPVPETASRLRSNVLQNGLDNVEIVAAAADDTDGASEIVVSEDSAYSSTAGVTNNQERVRDRLEIPSVRIDAIWERSGMPDVTVMKVDVEGAELAVLRGSKQLLQTCKPTLMVEAPTPQRLRPLQEYLGQLGYVAQQPSAFMPWNYLFVPSGGLRQPMT